MLIEIKPTGVLHKDAKKKMECETYKYRIEAGKDLIYQQTEEKLEKLKPENGWRKTNEPEEHLDEIAAKIQEEIKPKQILCFSYKDISLAERIRKKCGSRLITLYDVEKSVTMKHAEDAKDTAQDIEELLRDKEFDLVIWRHYMEHFEDFDAIIEKICKKVKDNGLIYVEVPDCEKFIRRGVPIFLWEQHKIYFEKSSLEKTLNCIGIESCQLYQFGESIEPSICAICRKGDSIKKRVKLLKKLDSGRQKQIDDLIKNYATRWKNYIKKENKPIYILGAGHNSDRFIQFTGIEDEITCIIDDDEEKEGMYMSGSKERIKNSRILKDENCLVIIGTHDRSIKTIKEKIEKISSKIEIKSIYEVPND